MHIGEPPLNNPETKRHFCETCSHLHAKGVVDLLRDDHASRTRNLCARLEVIETAIFETRKSLERKKDLYNDLCSKKSLIPQKRTTQNKTIKALEHDLPELRSQLLKLQQEEYSLEIEKAEFTKTLNRKVEKVWAKWEEVWVPEDDWIHQV